MPTLRYFPANAAYAFTFGKDIESMRLLNLDGFPMFYTDRKDAVSACKSLGLVLHRNGAVTVREPDLSFA